MLQKELKRRVKTALTKEELSTMMVYSRLFSQPCDAVLKALPKEDVYDTILIDNEATPWICAREFFTVVDPLTQKAEQWICGTVLAFEDRKAPIDFFTGCPRVSHTTDNFVMVPASEVIQLVHLVEDPRPRLLEEEPVYWINWWITFGPCTYPEHHRHNMQLQHVFKQL